ncbi:MAG: ABC transporter ATP-binding protein [Thermoleophilia bacterium]|nr:ABC transporter ATP-binding protein [Thermoleophilia bacterium]
MSAPVLRVEGLTVELESGEPVVEDVSLELASGEVLGLVGESGSGKTTTALALLGFARRGARIARGTVEVDGRSLTARGEPGARSLRGRLVSYVAQDPGAALNPSLRIRDLVGDMLAMHGEPVAAAVSGALASVHLPDDDEFGRRFPHQLSGGQQQRVAIATALVCKPRVVVLDEPTTGLDVVTQGRILDEIDRLRRERSLAVVYVSHDLAVVASVADRIAVMYAGEIVEEGPRESVLARPRHPYTRGLLASVPDLDHPRRIESIPGVAVGVGERPPGCAFAPRCLQRPPRAEIERPSLEAIDDGAHRVRCFQWRETPPLEVDELPSPPPVRRHAPLLEVEGLRAEYGSPLDPVVAVRDVSFAVARSECVALVGESGSGKSTLARCVAGLHAPAAGSVLLDGAPLAPRAGKRPRAARRRIQIVFQNPNDSLNPRHPVHDAIARPARILRDLSDREARLEVARLLERVRLPARLATRYPAELSGGERQRVAIARALAAQPELIVCDEITSALDVSVQAAVLELLAGLRAELELALLFITHDLGVVASVADRVLVLEHGALCDSGPVDAILRRPRHEYTRELVAAAPRLPRLTEVA